ncbi:response regulator [Flavobacterium terrae]|uniref:CheY chemotaxis protein or a CheY-like REC (Receiver) domain n=1 Tax=Flavobacterium terrae TaxID=415425 RepID=A0A1M6CSY1_9FLAO|nr:response regulator [Flavobacterium terrae]SHI64069.1 CheY chemotaxis protein or a CheY-like REC (receiver) domain [Flavobacterium terrae]
MKSDYVFLLIDDNSIDQLVTSQLLKKAVGTAEINIVNNGLEGLNWLNTNYNKLEKTLIILLDINMPIMNGFEFLAQYNSFPESLKNKTQVFMLSSTLNNNDIEQIRCNHSVKTLLSKPLSVKNFEEFI